MESQEFNDLKSVWEYFAVIDTQHARCSICPQDPITKQFTVIKTTNGSTTGLHRHLQTHKLAAKKRARRTKANLPTDGPPAKKVNLIFDAINDFSIDGQLARLVAKDRLSFLQIANSMDIQEGIKARLNDSTVNVPKNHNTIKDRVMSYATNTKNVLKMALQLEMKNSTWMSLDCDEWTSARRRRYLNISLFATNSVYWNLGLVRISGSANTERLVELLEQRLGQFGVNLKNNIVGMTTDGAPVAKKMARVAGIIGQQCLAHGVNLAVCDVLYKKHQEYQDLSEAESTEENSDEENDDDGSLYEIEEQLLGADMQSFSISGIVAKVRKLGVTFKMSTIYRDKLQRYVQEKFSDPNLELQLLIDVKTRWSSLFFMLERFCKISDCVEKVLIDFGSESSITAFDRTVVGAIVKSLDPIMLAIKALSERDCNLLKARVALKLALLEIWRQNNRFARSLAICLRRRIEERWCLAAGVLYYLKSGTYIDEFPKYNAAVNITEDDSDIDFFVEYVEEEEIMTEKELLRIFAVPCKSEIKKFIVTMLRRLCHKEQEASENAEEDDDLPVGIENIPPKSFGEIMREELRRTEEETSVNIPQESTLTKIVATEMDIFDKNKTRGAYLDKAFAMLMTIKASSVESERAFSSAGLICTKIRTRLNDDTLDNLCFLRSFFGNPSATSIPLS